MKRLHWLWQPRTVRRLAMLGGVLLLATVLAQFWIEIEAHFGVDGWFGFYAVFGLLACAAMVLVAKLLGFLVKRREDYYAAADDVTGTAPAAAPTDGSKRAGVAHD